MNWILRFPAIFIAVMVIAMGQTPLAAEFNTFVVSGTPAPDGNGVLSLPNAPAINSTGQMSFVSQLTGTSGGTSDNGGMFRYDSDGLVQIARKGTPFNGSTINFLLSSNIDESGTVSGVTSLSNGLIWYLIGNGGPLVSPFTLGSPSPSGNNTLLGVNTRAVNDGGTTAFRAIFNGASPEAGVYLRGTDGTISTLLKQFTTAPRGGTISGAGNRLNINESSQVATLLSINNEVKSVARLTASGNVELVREQDVLPDGVTTITRISTDSFSALDPIPLINNAGQIAFTAQYTQPALRLGVFLADDAGVRLLTPALPDAPSFPNTLEVAGIDDDGAVSVYAEFGIGGDPKSALYRADESTVDLVAIEGAATPVPGKLFRNIFKSAIATNEMGQIAFLAELSDAANGPVTGKGLYFYDPEGGLEQIIRTGDDFDGSVVTNLFFNGTLFSAISSQSPDTSGSGLNASGKVAFAFDLASGASGLATWYEPGVDGDFDGDSDVDGLDFLIWQRGESPNSLSSADLQLWQENFSGNNLAAVAVPEPHGLTLFSGILTLLALRNASKSKK